MVAYYAAVNAIDFYCYLGAVYWRLNIFLSSARSLFFFVVANPRHILCDPNLNAYYIQMHSFSGFVYFVLCTFFRLYLFGKIVRFVHGSIKSWWYMEQKILRRRDHSSQANTLKKKEKRIRFFQVEKCIFVLEATHKFIHAHTHTHGKWQRKKKDSKNYHTMAKTAFHRVS